MSYTNNHATLFMQIINHFTIQI